MNDQILRARADELCDVLYEFIKEVSKHEYFADPNWREMFEANIRIGRFLIFSIIQDEELLIREYGEYLDE